MKKFIPLILIVFGTSAFAQNEDDPIKKYENLLREISLKLRSVSKDISKLSNGRTDERVSITKLKADIERGTISESSDLAQLQQKQENIDSMGKKYDELYSHKISLLRVGKNLEKQIKLGAVTEADLKELNELCYECLLRSGIEIQQTTPIAE